MPNHVTNVLTASPAVIKAIVNDKDEIDFNLLIPMPEEVKNTTVGTGGYDHRDERGWYGWALKHWGTKWGGYDSRVEPAPGDLAVARFDTAWSMPFPFYVTLSKKFPEEELHIEWADEDSGSNQGEIVLKDGQITYEDTDQDGSLEAYERYARVKYPGMTWAEVYEEWVAEDPESAQYWPKPRASA